MKKKIIKIVILLCVSVTLLNCSKKIYVRNTDKESLVNRVFKEKKIDTVIMYQSSNLDFLWFYKENKLYSYLIKDNKVKKYQPVAANFINVPNSEIEKYFNKILDFEYNCFSNMELDGESISIYVKDKETKNVGFNLKCLTKTKFEINSFPYKLQYDFSKIFKPEGYSFEEMYGKEE